MIFISALGFLYRRQHSLGVHPCIVVPTITTSWSLEAFCSSVHLSLHTIWIREVVIRVVEIVVYCSSGDLLTQVLKTSNVWHNGVNLYIREWSEEPWRSMCFQHRGEIKSGRGCLLSACLQRDDLRPWDAMFAGQGFSSIMLAVRRWTDNLPIAFLNIVMSLQSELGALALVLDYTGLWYRPTIILSALNDASVKSFSLDDAREICMMEQSNIRRRQSRQPCPDPSLCFCWNINVWYGLLENGPSL